MSESISQDKRYDNKIAEIIQTTTISIYGTNGYKSIIKTMIKECGKTEREITTNYKLFEEMIEVIFGKIGNKKIMDPIKFEINKLGIDTVNESTEMSQQKKIKLLVAEDDSHILEIYKEWLKFENHEVVTAENGQKCLDIYKKEHEYAKSKGLENYFDVVILDHSMPIMTGVEAAKEILKLNPNQRIIFASGYIQKILSESITQINKAIEVIEKPFSIEALNNMITKKTLLDKFEEINSQNNETPFTKYSNALAVLNKFYEK